MSKTFDSPRQLRILVADDHPVVRTGIVAMVTRYGDLSVVCEAGDGAEAISAWRTHSPDLGLIDLSMPGLDGLGAMHGIRRVHPSARLVVMTTLGGDEDVHCAFQAGASGFLLKDCSALELATCLRAVGQGHKYLHAAAAARLADRVTLDALTGRERQVLECLALGSSNKLIGRQLSVAEGTVKTHVKNILSKLNVTSRMQAVRAARDRGLIHGR